MESAKSLLTLVDDRPVLPDLPLVQIRCELQAPRLPKLPIIRTLPQEVRTRYLGLLPCEKGLVALAIQSDPQVLILQTDAINPDSVNSLSALAVET